MEGGERTRVRDREEGRGERGRKTGGSSSRTPSEDFDREGGPGVGRKGVRWGGWDEVESSRAKRVREGG